MTILRLIDKLQQLKDLYGNVLVESRNAAGEFDEVCEIKIVNAYPTRITIKNNRVTIDA